jgi:hypothetical protein
MKFKIKEAGDRHGSNNPNSIPIIVNNVRYGCFKEASEILNMSVYKVKNRNI